MEKFTPLAKILHCRWHWRHGQIPPLGGSGLGGMMPKWYLHSESVQPEINRPASLAITLLIFCNQIHHLYLQANWLHQSRFVPKENRFLLWHVVWISEVSFGHCHLISFMKKETAMISISALWRAFWINTITSSSHPHHHHIIASSYPSSSHNN